MVVAIVVLASAMTLYLLTRPQGAAGTHGGAGLAVIDGTDARPDVVQTLNAKYQNGHLPKAELVKIGDGYRLVKPAALAFKKLSHAASRAGITLKVNSAYRTQKQQQALVDEYGLLADGGRAAPVGTSEHGWGIAVDLTLNADELAWFQKHAADYGFEATVTAEPWHWAYVGG